MKKAVVKKLSLGKIKVAAMGSKSFIDTSVSVVSISFKIACLSQGAPICSDDSCRH
ncbi:hypothetical protein [Chitinophaga sp. Cy-1792]|uniref:hypothetical protein n=1 Tax=Chitinophaga sp. Cy-1792 TaxID=2608339 RepID=UPI00141EEAC2|nr:hypothetical protein [Chitinophaga sp. Cy-1792]